MQFERLKEERDNEAGVGKDNEASLSAETVCKYPKCIHYDTKYQSSVSIDINVVPGLFPWG
jgi:hypothetical protein